MAHQLAGWLLCLLVVSEGYLELVSADWTGVAPFSSSVLQLKHKRQVALDLAFSRLRILESLDGQLRHWTAEVGASEQQQQQRRPQNQVMVCRLPLVLGPPRAGQPADTCPLSQVPPYMLNLQRMIVGQASSRADAVRLMPYGSLVARSFRQPPANHHRHHQDNTPQPQPTKKAKARAKQHRMHQGNPAPLEQQLVVELSLLDGQQPIGRQAEEEEEETASGVVEPVVVSQHAPATCNRLQLCYWFPLHRKLAKRINGSLDALAKQGGGASERLVEAELHLYKLAPKLLLDPPSTPRLKTDLLEVSLYQILANGAPERLLDIRRIDLHSIGWETFYARRALQDWVREPALNLGLVIKAKSMFKEPIGPGLIRFVDQAPEELPRDIAATSLTSSGGDGQSHQDADEAHDESREFNLSHQPTLVIYTTIESPAPPTTTS